MNAILAHPVCVELLKAELQAIHSVENLVFYLHVQRYRLLSRSSTRHALAHCIHAQFIRTGAPQEINLGTKQREAITAAVTRRGDDGCGVDLFKESEREVLQLIDTNVLKRAAGGSEQRSLQQLCQLVLSSMPLEALRAREADLDEEGSPEGEQYSTCSLPSS